MLDLLTESEVYKPVYHVLDLLTESEVYKPVYRVLDLLTDSVFTNQCIVC